MSTHTEIEDARLNLDSFDRDAELIISLDSLVKEHDRLMTIFNEVTVDETVSVIYELIAVEKKIKDIGRQIDPMNMSEGVVGCVNPVLCDRNMGRPTWKDRLMRFFFAS